MFKYTSLHNHTDYSNLRLIDSINTVEGIIDRGFELGLSGIAITDHDALSGHHKAIKYFEKKYKDSDYKLLLGNEIYLAREGLTSENYEKGESFFHLILIALDEVGHKQLRELSSRAWSRGFVRFMMRVFNYPSDLFDVVGANSGHIVCSTACLGGYPGRKFFENDYAKIDNFLSMLSGLFGKDKFFVELQPSHQQDQIDYNKFMIEKYWNSYPFIFTTDSHYLKAENREIHRHFLNSKSSNEREVDEFYASAYMMDGEEVYSFMKDYVTEEQFQTMADNSNKICSMATTYKLNKEQAVPRIQYENIDDNSNVFDFLDYEKYPYIKYYRFTDNFSDHYFFKLISNGWIKESVPQERVVEYAKRIEEELCAVHEISKQMGVELSDYFTTMAKIIDIIWTEGDSIVGPSRGSAGGFLINYLLGITQVDPLKQELELPAWRFLHPERPGLPDIDIDTESSKRTKVFNKVQTYFRGIGGDIVNICTFGTEGTKSALRTASRGLGLDQDIISYIVSMVPNERGFDWSLKQCMDGDEDHQPIEKFREEMEKYPELYKVARAIEGLITRLGVHASGVVVVNESFVEHNSFMKTSKGQIVSAFDLHDSEDLGLVKYDFLTVSGLDRIRQTLNYLLEDDVISWEGTLKATYDKYLSPKVLEYTNPLMWDMVANGEIVALFQFDTIVGSQAIRKIKPRSLTELAISNSLMRLMSDGELPIEVYARYKENIDLWYTEMASAGLTMSEVKILEKHLLKLSGVADSQESLMMIVMDPKIANFSMGDANKLRKTIAKKDFREIDSVKALFYSKGRDVGTSIQMLDYIWNYQISRQLGYSFSSIHTTGYSIMALQEMNLAYRFPVIYWNCACLSTDASAINEEDFYNLYEQGIVETSDDEDIRVSNKTDYAKIAIAIDKFRQSTHINLPDINKSRLGFTPDANNDSILYGLKGITRITAPVIQEIMANRPYRSLADFYKRVTKRIITKDKIVNLIKAGAFNRLEGKGTAEILRDFIEMVADQKQRLTLQNLNMLFDYEILPKSFAQEREIYKFTKELRKNRDQNKFYYILSDAMDRTLVTIPTKMMTIDGGDRVVEVIDAAVWDSKIYEPIQNKLRPYIKANEKELLKKLNDRLFADEWEKYASGDELQWELDSINMYFSGHPLKNVEEDLPLKISQVSEIKEGEIEGFFLIKGKEIPKMKLYSIAGTVLERDTTKSIVTLQTTSGVITIKIYKELFAFFSQVDENDPDEQSFFEKGTHLIVTGILRGETFIPKVYKNSKIKPILKLVLDSKNKFVDLVSK